MNGRVENGIITSLMVMALLLPSLAVIAPRAAAQGGAPDWSIGDYWDYRGEIDFMGMPYVLTLMQTVTGNAVIVVGGIAYDTFRSSVWQNATVMGNTAEMTGSDYVRTTDIASVMYERQAMGSTYEVKFDPPLEQFHFPLSDGQTWSQTVTAYMVVDGSPSTDTRTFDFSVAGPETVTVPAGTFSAFNVTMQERGTSNWTAMLYDDAVGYCVRQVLPMFGFGVMLLDLQSYRHVPNKAPGSPTVSAIPNPAYVDEPVTFTAAATDPDGDPLVYGWNFGDGGTGTGNPQNHAYTSAGSFTANVTVSDGRGGLSRGSVAVIVIRRNSAPGPVTLDAVPNPAEVGQLVAFTASAVDPDGDTVIYAWLFGDGGSADGAAVNHAYLAPGQFIVNVTASDGQGGFSWAEMTVTAIQPNAPPTTPVLTADPNPAGIGLPVAFTASATDPDGDPVSFSWEFGDGGTGAGSPVTHAYSRAGAFIVNATASDGRGGTSRSSVTVTVNQPNRPPGAVVLTANPNPADVGQTVTFTAVATDPDGDGLTYSWRFGDSATGTGSTASHYYSTAGTFIVNATASDGKGGESWAEATMTVVQPNRPPAVPTISASPNPAFVQDVITFAASATDPDGDTLTYSWRFGDGGTGSGGSASHAYRTAGTFKVNVTVSDGRGGESYVEVTVTVKERAGSGLISTEMAIAIVIIAALIAAVAAIFLRKRRKAASRLMSFPPVHETLKP